MSRRSLYAALGHYVIDVATGAIGAGMAANAEVFQFRWTADANLAIIQEISITGMRATTAFAVGAIDIKATVARAYTVVGSGGTALTLTTEEATLRTNMGTSLVGDARVATTAALTAGTHTLDTQDLGRITTHSSGGVGAATPIIGSIYLPATTLFKADLASGEFPLVLADNEGFVVRADVPGTGVWNLGIRVKWAEVEPSKF